MNTRLLLALTVGALVPSCAWRSGATADGSHYSDFTFGTDENDAETTASGTRRLAQNQSTSVKYGAQAVVVGIGLNEAGNAVSAISAGRTARAASRNATQLGIVTAKEATKQSAAELKAGVETIKILNP